MHRALNGGASGCALSVRCRRWRARVSRVAFGIERGISGPKIGLVVVVILAGGVIAVFAKFVFGVHGLLKLADVGYNVPVGPGALGAGGAGVAGGPQPVPAPVPTPDTPYGKGYKDGYDHKTYQGPTPYKGTDYYRGWRQGIRDSPLGVDWLTRVSVQLQNWADEIGGKEKRSSSAAGTKA